jgi:hypothetical protein
VSAQAELLKLQKIGQFPDEPVKKIGQFPDEPVRIKF